MEQFLEHNQNPVLRVEKNGTFLYSNKAGESLLQEWGLKVGGKLPLTIIDLVQRVFSRNNPEKMEVKVGKKKYLVVFHPIPEQESVNVSGFDITDQKELEEKTQGIEARDVANLELADILDFPAIQSLMDDLYELTHITIALVDLKGNVPVIAGMQEICSRFHRAHPEISQYCVESDINLSLGVAPGEFKLYRCKNNMWDVATPLIVGGQHIGNIFSGQFFFEDESLDYELFRSQARKYGFNEEEYIAALEKVPRLSREAVNKKVSFFMKLANILSQLSYSNIKLSQSLIERDEVVNALRESEKREQARLDELAVVLDAVPASVWITHDPQALHITGNRLSYEWLHLPEGVNISKSSPEGESPETYRLFKDGVEIPIEDMPVRMSASGIEVRDYEFDLVYPDGKMLHLLGNVKPLLDEHGNPQGAVSAFIDITERKQAEEEVQGTKNMLQLIMNNIPQGIFWKDNNSRYMGCNKVFAKATGIESPENIVGKTDYDLPWSPEQIEWFREYDRRIMENDIPEYQIVESQRRADGELAWVETNKVPLHDAKSNVIGILGTYEDITERKKAEEALKKAHENLEKIVEERTADLEKAYNLLKESEKGLAEAQKMTHIGNWDNDLVIGELHWSEEMYRIFGLNPHEGITYHKFLSCVHPEDRDYVYNSTKEAFNGKVYAIDYRIVRPGGEERTVHSEREVIFDERKKPVRMRGTIQDITEHKKAEEKLQILANAVESSNDAIVTLSLDGIITSWNKAAEQTYGYSTEEILGKDASILEPDNIKGEIKQISEKIKQGNKIQHYESTRLKKNGTIINISVTLSPIFDVTGKLVAISAIVRDVTERIKAEEALRESETHLRQFYESDMFGVFYFNPDGSITDANDKLLEIVGYTREDLQAGKVSWDKMTPPEYKALDEQAIAELRIIGVREPQEKVYIRKDGSHVPVNIGIAAFDQARNEGIAFVLDITEKKKAEEALANIENARKKEIHHRIKNNLQVISSLLDLQADKFDNPKVIEAFRESQDRVISMALIHEELYKGEGTDTLDFPAYLKELAENLFQTYSLSSKNIYLCMDLEENAFFNMDTAVPLGIIINEIVSNSLKHAFQGRDRGEIQIKLCREEGECKGEDSKIASFILTVSDNGVGIPENLNIEDLDSLGLQLITTLVDQLDGDLELKRNNGTEFTIRFKVTEKDYLAQVDLK